MALTVKVSIHNSFGGNSVGHVTVDGSVIGAFDGVVVGSHLDRFPTKAMRDGVEAALYNDGHAKGATPYFTHNEFWECSVIQTVT